MPLTRDHAEDVACLRRFAEDMWTLHHLGELRTQWLRLPLLSSHVLCEDASRTYTEAMQRYHRLMKDMTAFEEHRAYLQRVFLHQMQAYARQMPTLGACHAQSTMADEAGVLSKHDETHQRHPREASSLRGELRSHVGTP